MDDQTIERAELIDLGSLERLSDFVQALHATARPDVFRMPVDIEGRRAFFRRAVEDENWGVWIAKIQGRAVAYAMTETMQKTGPIRHPHTEGHLHQICVDPDFRRNGVGRALTHHAITELKRQSVDRITVAHWTFNKVSGAFFADAGFTPVLTTLELFNSHKNAT